MEMLTTSSGAMLPLLPPVGQHRGRMKAKDLSLRRYSSQLQTLNGRRQSVFAKAGPVFLKPIPSTGMKGGDLCSSRRNNAFMCFAALNARCAAEQTQTVTREAPTITVLPGKEKSPQLDDGDSGFPPRDDGDGGGGGGGGGGNWSGGFFFFGFLAFLGFLKDKESEGPYQNDRRR
ncbi:protein YELLOW LEAF 1, choloroplastic-like isoform X2 [Benincasa hispida]|uniref:protein YELLOW LEAF 1, choloroplastic-like isoform X2 n=1 Tax=Benincasa hispida TaxID=102211 RepID=UPI001902AE3E|nr:protein YELLOW LEAF 1, choloroplastic-like isoform X2 [Benincasa hispida]XP_038905032.1 protein YELLOW LEAF 1, choloroplastic-like isoform X2 [Benincasa hispida]XP_038905033.1 protein YELLOW LEAF 1, choloroplastic-like isoform X2 [Benincasa hispida]